MKLKLEIRTDKKLTEPVIDGGLVLLTPPISEDWWLYRVKLSDKQAIVGFPKFGQIGIGFAVEEDWNTNLPSQCPAAGIFNHIKDNKGDDAISDADCIAAIEMVREVANRQGGVKPEHEQGMAAEMKRLGMIQ